LFFASSITFNDTNETSAARHIKPSATEACVAGARAAPNFPSFACERWWSSRENDHERERAIHTGAKIAQ
jgi:hypothetical protein